MTTTGIDAIKKQQDALDPKAWASLTALGPIIAGIAWAGATQLGIPNGYVMVAACITFALFVGMAHAGEAKIKILAYFLAASMILFWQASLVATSGQAMGGVASALVEDARARDYTVTRTQTGYTVQSGKETWTVPFGVYRAIRAKEARWGVKF